MERLFLLFDCTQVLVRQPHLGPSDVGRCIQSLVHPAGTSLRLGLQILFGCIVAFLNQGIIPAYTSNFLSPGPVAKQGIKKSGSLYPADEGMSEKINKWALSCFIPFLQGRKQEVKT